MRGPDQRQASGRAMKALSQTIREARLGAQSRHPSVSFAPTENGRCSKLRETCVGRR